MGWAGLDCAPAAAGGLFLAIAQNGGLGWAGLAGLGYNRAGYSVPKSSVPFGCGPPGCGAAAKN